jgi:DNA-binding response OmpR family regulator
MADKPRILLIDDDRKLTRLLGDLLAQQGFEVDAVYDGAEGIRRAQAGGWHLIVLDVMLPALDGLSVLRHLRTLSNVPVLMLTGRGAEDDRVAGLEQGADDYLPKTCSARELLARIRAILRRSAADASRAAAAITLGSLQINRAAREVRLNGTGVELTAVEFELLLALAGRPGEVCTREQLLEEVRDREFTGAERSIDMHIAALRRKLGDDPRAPSLIRTVRSAGYLLVASPKP